MVIDTEYSSTKDTGVHYDLHSTTTLRTRVIVQILRKVPTEEGGVVRAKKIHCDLTQGLKKTGHFRRNDQKR